MSHYVDVTTEIKDEKALVKALGRLGYQGMVEVYDHAVNLYGYRGDMRSQKANVVLRRKNLSSASNDIGFERMSDGRYRAHISEYDESIGYNEQWRNKLYTYYGVEKAKMDCKARGYKYVEDVDEKQRPRLRVSF